MREQFSFSSFPTEQFIELTIHQFGYEKCPRNHSFGPTTRNHYLFHYILSGKGLLISTDEKGSNQAYALTQGQGFMFWPGQTNHYIANDDDPWTYIWIEFDGLQARELLSKAGLTYNNPIYIDKSPALREQMAATLMYIITNATNPPLELIGHFYIFMNALVSSSAKSNDTTRTSLREFYVQEAIAYIELNYHRDISVQDIADYCNLHRSYLNRIFKTVLGIAPQQFIIRFRIKKACELLKLDNRPIGELCILVGYPDQLNFSRVFKREIGTSPHKWRTKNRLANS